MRVAPTTRKRCFWVNEDDPLLLKYHDQEWGALLTATKSISKS